VILDRQPFGLPAGFPLCPGLNVPLLFLGLSVAGSVTAATPLCDAFGDKLESIGITGEGAIDEHLHDFWRGLGDDAIQGHARAPWPAGRIARMALLKLPSPRRFHALTLSQTRTEELSYFLIPATEFPCKFRIN
jgi:hypothetical protein